ncbi:MAG: sortase, partial [Lachnospiraceae bacterium]|nr:sortase [Lachnospiraceae bacterium]
RIELYDGIYKTTIKEDNTEHMSRRDPYKKISIRNVILIVLAVICLVIGVILLLIDPIKNMKRQAVTDDMMESIVEGSQAVFVVKSDENEVNGEEYEYDFGVEELNNAGGNYQEIIEELPDETVLTALGWINIPSVKINIPLWNEATKVSLRYGAGRLEKTADPGDEGNMVILGHRMRAEGKLFNRLGDVKIGDDIIITTIDGAVYTYKVDKILEAVKPENLEDYVDIDDGEGTQVTLVTCTPLGVATHRLLIIGHLI